MQNKIETERLASATLSHIMNEAHLSWEDAVLVERDEILECNEANIIAQEHATINKIRSWLRPTDFDSKGSEYHKHLSSYLPGTGAWVLASQTYQQWLKSVNHGLLWVRGIPGSGKSVLAAKFVRELSQEQVPVLYFFFRQTVDANCKPRAAIQDWLAQVLLYSPPLQLVLKAYLEPSDPSEAQSFRPRELDSISMSDLWQHLRTALSHIRRAYLVVDALDEMDQTPDAEAFLQHLSALACWQPSRIKITMTSRPVVSMKRLLSRTTLLRLRLDEENVDHDIGAYVLSRLEQSKVPTEYYLPIQAAVPGRAKGLFLYAKLAMDALLADGVNVRQALGKIPENLDQMYTQLLRQHAVRSGVAIEVQQLIMQWITHSVRPLRLIELADILAHHTSSERDLGAAKQILRLACGSLLELLPDEMICVVHHSLTEFLTGQTRTGSEEYPILESKPTHSRLARLCLAYLQNGCLENAEPTPTPYQGPSDRPPAEPLLAPFTRYAAVNWSTHAIRSGNFEADEMNGALDEFTTHTQFQKWAYMAGLRKAGKEITPLFMAIALGLPEYLRYLLARPDANVDEGTPIVWAAAKGFTNVVHQLVERGASLDRYDAEGYTALHRAAMNNHPATVAILLQAGCNMNVATTTTSFDSGFGRSQHQASWFACNHGHTEVLAELQKFMATSKQVGYALTTAVKHKRAELVRQLLEHPMVRLNPDLPDSQSEELKFASFEDSHTRRDRQNAPLVLACENRDLVTIKLLLAAGADANNDALHALARSKAKVNVDTSVRCFSLMIGAGADLNARDHDCYKYTPLQQAADATAARMLLEAGADVEAENRDGETAVFTCVDVDVLKVLVEVGGANLEKRNKDGKTPLLASLYASFRTRKQAPVIAALIDLGADVDAVDEEGNGAFHCASKSSYARFPEGIIERLCAAGADINRPNKHGECPIHLEKIEIRKPFDIGAKQIPREITRFEILVAAGARLTHTATDVSRNPLFKWISDSFSKANERDLPDVMEVLVRCGASLHITDDEGRSLLHDATQVRRSKAEMHFLLKQGLDPMATDHKGNTLWHEAALQQAKELYRQAHVEPFEQLYQLGLDPMQPNHLGRNPLHVLSSLWPSGIHSFKHGTRSGIHSSHANSKTAFDYTLSLSSEVDIPDEDGVTPLHLASTFCEYIVGKLLARGANPSRATKEGCNAFHLAACAKKPNIMKMMLLALQFICPSKVESAVTFRDRLGRTPLYYACLAGSYECAQSLIDAGATADNEDYQTSPWRAIARFEIKPAAYESSSLDPTVGDVLIAHDSDPLERRTRYFNKDRIDELLALLAANTAVTLSTLDQAILDAAALKADYTVEHLIQARETAHPGEYIATDRQVISSVERRRTKREDLMKPCKNCERMHCMSHLGVAWYMDDYRLFAEALIAESDSEGFRSTVRRLVSNGQAAVIQRIVALGGPQALDDRSWIQQSNTQEARTSDNQEKREPLLLSACRRAAPNMDMIRVLVEQAQLDVNAQHQFSENREASDRCFLDSGRYVKGESPLHALVRGEHWWHVNEALRYLLDRGANTELQDVTGMTPLSAVLNRCAWLIFDKTVVELLIQYGADVNAVDRAGDSCLAKACTDLEMVRLLLDHGAVVTQRVLIQAIDLKDFELLSLFLSRGGDPNVRGERKWPGSISVGYADRYPLHYAIASMTRSWRGEEDKYERIVRTLLSHGADLCAGYGSTTILHELVRDYDDLTAILTLPSSTLNLNVVNAEGETPLHLACNKRRSLRRGFKMQSIATLLVARGADIRATDGQGNTIWHILARTGAYGHTDAELQNLLASAQDLINTPNAAGETPLHIAMGKMHYSRILDLLLDNSGYLHARDGAGNSLLHVLLRNDWAVCMSGHVKKRNKQPFERLLAAGLDINARNDKGETPIFSFFRHAKVERWSELRGPSVKMGADTKTSTSTCTTAEAYQAVYDIFAAAGVDWLATNAKGQNLLHITAGLRSDATLRHGRQPRVKVESSRIRKFKVLVGYGLDTAAEDGEGRTPLDIAADLGHEDILDLFREH